MPPHCDSMDGPVVLAAKQALASRDADLVLPFVPAAAEAEARAAFAATLDARAAGGPGAAVADRWFFETGPVVPLAEQALASGNLVPLYKFLTNELHEALHTRFGEAQARKAFDPHDVAAARAYTSAMLGFQVWAHSIHLAMGQRPHASPAGHAH